MTKIAFFISDHGYGHATRTIKLLELLHGSKDDIEIILCSEYANHLVSRELARSGVKSRTYNYPTEYGIAVTDGVTDLYKTLTGLPKWTQRQRAIGPILAKWLEKEHIDYIFTDISPYPFLMAEKLDIPSAGFSNFSWADQYLGMLLKLREENRLDPIEVKGISEAVDDIQRAYSASKICFAYPFEMSLAGFQKKESVPLIARKSTLDKWKSREIVIEQAWHPKKVKEKEINTKFLVFLSLGMSLPLSKESRSFISHSPSNWHFICPQSSGSILNGLPNVSLIPPSTLAVNDWMKACDLVISKPGYSTVSEALLNRIPLAVLPLETPEAMTTLSILAERGWATTISLTGTDSASFDRLESLRIPILPECLISSDIGPIIKFMQS
ncbi:MAG TPA: hypothetical protein VJ044_00370 [Candidatus Hodarchaeales archaeon]|nr:hypothetical protein [Candidatus Hodarchaeales archaeon]